MDTTTETSPAVGTSQNGAGPRRTGKRAALELLQEWLSDESGYDEATWPRLKQALEENRSSAERRLFHE